MAHFFFISWYVYTVYVQWWSTTIHFLPELAWLAESSSSYFLPLCQASEKGGREEACGAGKGDKAALSAPHLPRYIVAASKVTLPTKVERVGKRKTGRRKRNNPAFFLLTTDTAIRHSSYTTPLSKEAFCSKVEEEGNC